jgi:hypothetical protein
VTTETEMEPMPRLLFPTGAATQKGAVIIIQVLREDGTPLEGCLLADYRHSPDPEVFATDWRASSICYHEAEDVVYAVGANGEVVRLAEGDRSEEYVSPGSAYLIDGPIREIRSIGPSLFAVGMGRQVYERLSQRQWVRRDSGILEKTGRSVCGLTSITGDGDGFLVAVGYEGEIWEYHDGWVQVDSPTNTLLNRVVRFGAVYYAAGIAGTLLVRAKAGWRAIEIPDTEADIWDLTIFGKHLFIATATGLLRMSADEQFADTPLPQPTRSTALTSGGGLLWCLGSDRVFSTADGESWSEETIIH